MTIYQIGLLQVGFLCFTGLCIYALGKAVAPKRKPEPNWKAIAGRLYDDLTVAIEEYKTSAMREYEEAAKHD